MLRHPYQHCVPPISISSEPVAKVSVSTVSFTYSNSSSLTGDTSSCSLTCMHSVLGLEITMSASSNEPRRSNCVTRLDPSSALPSIRPRSSAYPRSATSLTSSPCDSTFSVCLVPCLTITTASANMNAHCEHMSPWTTPLPTGKLVLVAYSPELFTRFTHALAPLYTRLHRPEHLRRVGISDESMGSAEAQLEEGGWEEIAVRHSIKRCHVVHECDHTPQHDSHDSTLLNLPATTSMQTHARNKLSARRTAAQIKTRLNSAGYGSGPVPTLSLIHI
eukprot:TRINITY_DN7901_c0_g1_i2.p1 TRINITY_DN7901_c0_g1~~TRINITY_DN7901_c0_g1_i2.p1  ORF type:complete len:276 (+),score=12.83 TRINITY_DN7901_c0_g1_i2:394-1221(+)